ncbi:MAG: hypothetical protein ACR2NS_12055 [Gemmatimonadaceae bacterium]
MQRRPFQSLSFLFLAALASIACRPAEPEQRYGFIARLGSDTVSVESITRRENTVVVDGVDRFPRVRRRHTEIELGPGSTIRHLVMDIHTPSEPANQRERHVTAEVTADSVHILQTDGAGKLRHDFATAGAVAMAHVPQMYSLYELYFDAALARAAALKRVAGDTVQLRQFYVDPEFDRFPLHHGVVRLLSNNRAEIQHDWLAGPGQATFDSTGRMLTYSGARTTYLVEITLLRLRSRSHLQTGRNDAHWSEPEDGAVSDRSKGYMRDDDALKPNTETLPYRGTSAVATRRSKICFALPSR